MNIISLRPETIIRNNSPLWRNTRAMNDSDISDEERAIIEEMKRRRTIH